MTRIQFRITATQENGIVDGFNEHEMMVVRVQYFPKLVYILGNEEMIDEVRFWNISPDDAVRRQCIATWNMSGNFTVGSA